MFWDWCSESSEGEHALLIMGRLLFLIGVGTGGQGGITFLKGEALPPWTEYIYGTLQDSLLHN